MNISESTISLILYGMLSSMPAEQREKMAQKVGYLYQNGSSGDGAFDTRVRRSFNKEVENAQAIFSAPSILIAGR